MPRTSDRHALGGRGEEAALRVYTTQGYRAVARNWRCHLGEIDLVIERDGVIVFCEVKTRTPSTLGAGWEAVTASKRARIRRLAEVFLLSSRTFGGMEVRFDVASVVSRDARLDVEIFEEAF